MLTTYWHISGPGFDVDDFLSRHGLSAEKHWYQGQKNENGEMHEESGCTILISDCDDTEQHFDQVNEFLESRFLVIEELAERGIQSTVDTAFSVGSEDSKTRSVKLSSGLLCQLGNAGVKLEVSAQSASNGHGKSKEEEGG